MWQFRSGNPELSKDVKRGLLYDIFENGFTATLRYKERFGDANTSRYFTTPDGYELGHWQSEQRVKYKSRQLMPHEIKQLEEIGFKWDFK